MRLQDCHNFHDFRRMARRRLPGPIFNYIDGARGRRGHLPPQHRRLRGLRPGAQRAAGRAGGGSVHHRPGPDAAAAVLLFPHRAAAAVPPRRRARRGAAAGKYGTMFGVSSLGTTSLEEARRISSGPQVYQFYFHKDRALNREMMARAKQAGVQVMMLTVDSITGGNRERDKRTGFAIPFRLNAGGDDAVRASSRPGRSTTSARAPSGCRSWRTTSTWARGAMSISHYFTEMLDPVADLGRRRPRWCRSGTGSSASRASCRRRTPSGRPPSAAPASWCPTTAGGSSTGRAPSFDQLAEIVDAAGDRLDVLMDGGVQRGTHVLKALSLGAKAVGRRPLLPVPARGRGAGGRGARAGADAGRDRARHATDGLRLRRPAEPGKPAVPVSLGVEATIGSGRGRGNALGPDPGNWSDLDATLSGTVTPRMG